MLRKMQMLIFTALVTGSFVLCAGCGKSVTDMKTITDADNGTTVAVAKGELFRLRIASQLSTGFSWQITASPANIALEGKPGVEPNKDKMIVGGIEHQLFTFTAKETGEGTLELAYSRPWEKKVKPAKTYNVKIAVK